MRQSRSRSPDVSVESEGGASSVTPEKRLLTAIVRRALWDYVLYAERRDDPELHEIGIDAAAWLFWDGEEEVGEDGTYTFLYVCGVLGLDPRAVRNAAAELTPQDLTRMNNNIKEA